MAKNKKRRTKRTAQPEFGKQFAADILSGTIAGLIVLAVTKLLNW